MPPGVTFNPGGRGAGVNLQAANFRGILHASQQVLTEASFHSPQQEPWQHTLNTGLSSFPTSPH